MHWRRFPTSSIPLDEAEFTTWLNDRWREKDALMEHYVKTGKFPADEGSEENPYYKPGAEAEEGMRGQKVLKGAGHLKTDVRPKGPLEFLGLFVPPATFYLLLLNLWKMVRMVLVVLGLKKAR